MSKIAGLAEVLPTCERGLLVAHRAPALLLVREVGVAVSKYIGEDGLQEAHLLVRRMIVARRAPWRGEPQQVASVKEHEAAPPGCVAR